MGDKFKGISIAMVWIIRELAWSIQEEVVPRPAAIGGHFAEVTDLCWDSSGTYLLTCSFDMTTRIFAALKQVSINYLQIPKLKFVSIVSLFVL